MKNNFVHFFFDAFVLKYQSSHSRTDRSFQTKDEDFLEILNEIRDGNLSENITKNSMKDTFQILNQRRSLRLSHFSQ